MLKDKIQKDLLEAMKAKDEIKLGALRMLKSAIMKFEVSGDSKKIADDEVVLTLLAKEIKSRKEAAEAFKTGDRDDLAKKEMAEIEALTPYMPTQLNENEIQMLAKEAITATGAISKADFGKVMAAMMPKVKGKADGQVVSKIVGELLK